MAGELTIGLADTTPGLCEWKLNATVRVAMLAACGDALVLTPVAIVTVHSECLDSDASPPLDPEAFSTIMAPHVVPPVATAACDCPPLPYDEPAASLPSRSVF